MPIDHRIEDSDLEGFTPQAKEHLRNALGDYSAQVIREAQRIEAGRNNNAGSPEITQAMVRDAMVLLTHGVNRKTRNWKMILARIAAGALPLLVGILYNSEWLQSPWYMAMYVAVIVVTIVAITISIVME